MSRPAAQRPEPGQPSPCRPGSRRFGILLAGAGLAMMLYGIFRGEAGVVLEKAIRICMECIGIG